MILDIIKIGDPNWHILRAKNIDVKIENPFLGQLIADMFETLDNYGGVGLAAPQVGHNLNLFIIKAENFKEVFINPEIRLSGLRTQKHEACLSFPNMNIPVDRLEKVEIKYTNKDWQIKIAKFDNSLSTIIQHEYDHLKGKLIID